MFAYAKIGAVLLSASLVAFAQTRPGTAADAGQPAEVTGALLGLDDKKLAVETPDGRIVELARGPSVRFTRDGAAMAPSELSQGDQVKVYATRDSKGFFTAHEVIFLKSADAPAREPQATGAGPEPPPVRITEPLAPAPPDPDDPGPPRLRRGRPATRKPTPTLPPSDALASAPAPATSAAAPTPGAPAPASTPAGTEPAPDPLIEKAREAADSFTASLPNYICQQITTRYVAESRAKWRALDVVSADVAYENGSETYRNIAVNGKKVNKTFEELGGAWSQGEFGSLLKDLFSPASGAEFRFRRDAVIGGLKAAVYDYEVTREGSHWRITSGSQSYYPAYKGTVWIDRSNGRVLRIESQARDLPREFPLDTAEVSSDYQYVRIGGVQPFLVPVHAETLTCPRGTSYCHRNTIDFRNYRKYSGDASITFEEKK